jgi:hypothetical protein
LLELFEIERNLQDVFSRLHTHPDGLHISLRSLLTLVGRAGNRSPRNRSRR